MKKFLSIILSILLIVSVVPMGLFSITASAAASDIERYYTYTISNGEATIVNVDTNISGNVEVPQNFGEYPVVKIGYKAFANCSNITAITIPDSVKEIEEAAFFGCNGLVEMTIPFVGQYASPVFDTSKTSHKVKEQLFGYIFGTEEFEGAKETWQFYGTYNSNGTALYRQKDGNIYKYVNFLYQNLSYKNSDYEENINNIKTRVEEIKQQAFDYFILNNSTYTGKVIYYAAKNDPCTGVKYYIPSSLEKVTVTGDYKIYFGAFSGTALREIYINSKTATIATATFLDSSWWSEIPESPSLQDVINSLHPTKIYCYPGSKLENYFLSKNYYPYAEDGKLGLISGTHPWGGYYIPPEKPTVERVTDSSVTLVKDDLLQYSLNGTSWQDSNVFTGLSPNTQYTFYQRYKQRTSNGITINASEKSDALIVTTKGNLQKISIDTLPNKLSFVISTETLRVDGGKLLLEYEGGETDVIDMDLSMVSGFNNETLGTKTLTVTYSGKYTAYDINIVDKNITSFYIYSMPNKLVYEKDVDGFDVTGGKIRVSYSNATSETIDMTMSMILGYDSSKPGKQTVTVSFRGLSQFFEITVKDRHAQPAVPVIDNKNSDSITLRKTEGYEYSLDGQNWTTNNVFLGLEAQTKYSFYQRVAETETTLRSSPSSALYEYTRPNVPEVIDISSTSILVKEMIGYEYSIDKINWQDSNLFENLIPDQEYSIYQQYKGMDNPSFALKVYTDHGYTDIYDTICDVCNKERFLVLFDFNGGIGEIDIQYKEADLPLTLTTCTPTRSGYRFAGWSTTKSGDVEYQSGDTYAPNKSVTLYAQWDILCAECAGDGTVLTEEDCSNCTDGITGYTNCSVCNGSGKYGEGTEITCALCGGSGSVKDAFGKWISCFACGGDGWGMSYPTCYSCNGAKKYPKYCAECAGDGTVPTEGDCKNCKGVGGVDAYHVHFDANGGSGAPDDQIIAGYTNTLVTGKPSKTDYIFKGWKLLDDDTVYQPGDVYNAGENTLYAIWHKKCENCNGSGSVSSTWNCSTCDGEGRRRYCASCGSYYITKHVTGYYGTYYSCSSCGSTSTSTTSCSSCGGDGVLTGMVSCSHCSGVGCLKEDDKATNLPVVESNDKSSITLAFIEGYEYSLDGINWQSDTTFNGLESGVEYTFYQRVRITNNAVCGVASEGRKVIILSAGDLDEDDDITDWDGVLLARHLAGWNVGISNSVLDIDGDGEVTDWDGVMFDRYLAGWSVEVFVGTGKAVSIYSITYTDDKNAENSNPTTYKTGQKLKLLPLEKEHYRFDGWYYMGKTITELSGNENGDIILIAQWTPVKYNVTYLDTRNNTNSLNPKYITADDGTLNLFDLPATNGYAFDGWVDSSGRKVTSIVATGQDIKLTATWVFDSVAIIDTKHDYNTKKYEVSYTYASEMGATGNFTVTYQVSIKNVWDYQITTGSVWFHLVDKNGNYAGSSFSASVVFLPVGETYVWEYEMNAVPKGEYTLIISD